MHKIFEIQQMNLENAGYISSYLKKTLKELNIEKEIIRRVSIATYEAEINVVIHSYGGKCSIDIENNRLIVIFEDTGPGIINIEQAMKEGFSTASQSAIENGFGAGMGLPNIKKSSDEFYIKSSPKGTNLKIVFLL